MSDVNTATAPEVNAPAEVNGKPKSASQLLNEVHAESDAPAKANPGKQDKTKKPAKPKAVKPAKAEATAVPVEAPKPVLSWLTPPEPTAEKLKVKTLTLDPRLQHRKNLQDVSEGGAVDRYAELYKDGITLPPIKVIRDISETPTKGTLWVYDGFQRTGAKKKNNDPEIDADVIDGTFADAMYLSLGSNGENSVLPRTREDVRRSILTLLDNKEMWAQVAKASKGDGGLHRWVAKICNCSTGAVTLALASRGYKVKGESLVKIPAPPAVPATTPATPTIGGANPAEGPTQSQTAPTEEQQKAADSERYKELASLDMADKITQAKQAVRKVGALFASLLDDPVTGPAVRESLSNSGFAVADGWDKEKAEKGSEFFPAYAVQEHWPIINALATAIEDAGESAKWAVQGAEEAAKKNTEGAAAQ